MAANPTLSFSAPAIARRPPAQWPYWLVTGLLAAYISLGALLDVAQHPEAMASIRHLGYPAYFVRYIGLAKLLGVVAVLLPGRPRLKEWAYAGLFFDTFSAGYSAVATGDAPATGVPALVGLALTLGSYRLYRRRRASPLGRELSSPAN